jgi:hypothetical protein
MSQAYATNHLSYIKDAAENALCNRRHQDIKHFILPADPKNIPKNLPIPCTTCSMVDSPAISGPSDSKTVVVKTMATASFRMDSPNTSMLRTGSTSMAWVDGRDSRFFLAFLHLVRSRWVALLCLRSSLESPMNLKTFGVTEVSKCHIVVSQCVTSI